MGDAKKESYDKKRLHPKRVGSKSPNSPHPTPLPPKEEEEEKKRPKKNENFFAIVGAC